MAEQPYSLQIRLLLLKYTTKSRYVNEQSQTTLILFAVSDKQRNTDTYDEAHCSIIK
jgi:hypothetical protein